MTKNKVFLNQDDIVEIHVIGDQTDVSVLEMGDKAARLLEELTAQQKPLLILDDITQMGNTTTAARQAVQQLAKTLPYQKGVMLGTNNPLMLYGTRLLLRAIGLGNKLKYFVDRDAAIKWLLS